MLLRQLLVLHITILIKIMLFHITVEIFNQIYPSLTCIQFYMHSCIFAFSTCKINYRDFIRNSEFLTIYSNFLMFRNRTVDMMHCAISVIQFQLGILRSYIKILTVRYLTVLEGLYAQFKTLETEIPLALCIVNLYTQEQFLL